MMKQSSYSYMKNVDEMNKNMDQLSLKMHNAPSGYQFEQPLKLSLRELKSLGSVCIGWKVLVESLDGHYIGYICWMLDHCSRLGLEEASRPDSGVKIMGVVLLYYRCITSITLISKRSNSDPGRNRASCQQSSTYRTHMSKRSLLMKKIVPPSLLDNEAEGSDSDSERSPVMLPLPAPRGGLRRPNTWHVIDRLGEHYRAALKELSAEKRVGTSCFGYNLGRRGELAWLCLASQSSVYLFDVATIGLYETLHGVLRSNKRSKTTHVSTTREDVNKTTHVSTTREDVNKPIDEKPLKQIRVPIVHTNLNALLAKQDLKCQKENIKPSNDNELAESNHQLSSSSVCHIESTGKSGPIYNPAYVTVPVGASDCLSLADLLSNELIEKVMHDSRSLCDFLYHNTDVDVNNIYDTQVTELYLCTLEYKGDCPAFVSSLSSLLRKYFNMSHQHFLGSNIIDEDPSVLHERPLPASILSSIASTAMFLRELQHAQDQLLMADLRQLTAVHASTLALTNDVIRDRVELQVVPEAVQRLFQRTVLSFMPSKKDL